MHEGKQAVLRALEAIVASYDENRFVPDEFLEQGDTIVVLAHVEVRKGDRSLKLPAVIIWRYETDNRGGSRFSPTRWRSRAYSASSEPAER